MSASEALARIRALGAARAKAFYDRHKIRILADRREGNRLLREQRRPAEAPAEHHYDEPVYDVQPAPPAAPAAAPQGRIKYDVVKAVDCIKRINELYPNEPHRAASTLKNTVSAIRSLFKNLSAGNDLYKKLIHPDAVRARLEKLVVEGVYKRSTMSTHNTLIMLLFDHLPHFGLSDDIKNNYRHHVVGIRDVTLQASMKEKQSSEYNVHTYPVYLAKINKEYEPGSIESLIAHMYSEVPVRDNFRNLRIVNNAADAIGTADNFLILSRTDPSVKLNTYKTAKKYNRLNLPNYPVSDGLAKMLHKYIAKHKLAAGEYLFPQFVKSGLGKIVKKMNISVGIMKHGINALRSMAIATQKVKDAHLPEKEQNLNKVLLASKMRHSHITAPIYEKNIIVETPAPVEPVKRSRGRPKKAAV